MLKPVLQTHATAHILMKEHSAYARPSRGRRDVYFVRGKGQVEWEFFPRTLHYSVPTIRGKLGQLKPKRV